MNSITVNYDNDDDDDNNSSSNSGSIFICNNGKKGGGSCVDDNYRGKKGGYSYGASKYNNYSIIGDDGYKKGKIIPGITRGKKGSNRQTDLLMRNYR